MGLTIAIDLDEAVEHGYHGAAILQQVRWWSKFHDSEWFRGSSEKLAELTALSPDQVRRTVKILVDKGAMEKRKMRSTQSDHTLSYRVTSEAKTKPKTRSNSDVAKSPNRIGESAESGCGEIAESTTSLDTKDKDLTTLQNSASPSVAEAAKGGAVEVANSKPKQATRKRGTRLPEGWEPHPDLVRKMSQDCPTVDQDFEVEQFRDYWHAKAGQHATKLDWSATYRSWIRNASRRAPSTQSRSERTEAARVDAWAGLIPDASTEPTGGQPEVIDVGLFDSCELSSRSATNLLPGLESGQTS